jgi:methylmalonyl-CoA mutase C-terminal domain/subunit
LRRRRRWERTGRPNPFARAGRANVRGVSILQAAFDSSTTLEVPVETKTDTIRVIIAKVGLDGHDRGVKIVARALRDGGMDVIYTGLHRTAEEVVDAAIQEDVDVLGVSLLSGAHMTIFPKILNRLKERDAGDIIVVGGGVMPDEEAAELKKMGVKEILLQDTPPEVIVNTVRRLVQERGPK